VLQNTPGSLPACSQAFRGGVYAQLETISRY
jgi:hypothetical protein